MCCGLQNYQLYITEHHRMMICLLLVGCSRLAPSEWLKTDKYAQASPHEPRGQPFTEKCLGSAVTTK